MNHASNQGMGANIFKDWTPAWALLGHFFRTGFLGSLCPLNPANVRQTFSAQTPRAPHLDPETSSRQCWLILEIWQTPNLGKFTSSLQTTVDLLVTFTIIYYHLLLVYQRTQQPPALCLKSLEVKSGYIESALDDCFSPNVYSGYKQNNLRFNWPNSCAMHVVDFDYPQKFSLLLSNHH